MVKDPRTGVDGDAPELTIRQLQPLTFRRPPRRYGKARRYPTPLFSLTHRFGISPGAAARWVHERIAPCPAPNLRGLTVLDPAAGSGAFLLGTLDELVALRCAAGEGPALAVKRDVLAHSLFGVDLTPTAVRARSGQSGTAGSLLRQAQGQRRLRDGAATSFFGPVWWCD